MTSSGKISNHWVKLWIGKTAKREVLNENRHEEREFLDKMVEYHSGEEFPKWEDFICLCNNLRKWDFGFGRGKTPLGKTPLARPQWMCSKKKCRQEEALSPPNWKCSEGFDSQFCRVKEVRGIFWPSGNNSSWFERNQFFFNSFLPAIFLDVRMNFVIDFFLILLLAYL